MLGKYVKHWVKYPKTLLIGFALLFCALATIAVQLPINPDFSALISQEGSYNTDARALEKAFDRNGGLQIVYRLDEQSIIQNRPSQLSEQYMQTTYEQLTNLLGESQYVRAIGPLEIEPEGQLARVSVATFEPNKVGSEQIVREEIELLAMQASTPPGVEMQVTGFSTLLNRVSTLLIEDNLRTVLITALLVFGVLLLYYRKLKLAIIGVTAPLLSLLTLAAVMVLTNIEVTLTLAAVGVIVVGLGADYSIHLMTAYVRHIKEKMTPKEAIIEAFDELDIALIAAFLTTAAGFSALMLGVSPSSYAQGLTLTLAITVIFFITILVLPLLLVVFVKQVRPEAGRTPKFIDNSFDKLSHYQANHPWRVIIAILAITAVMLVGASQVGFSTSNSNWIPDDDPISESFRELAFSFGDEETVSIVIRSTKEDLRNIQTIRDLQELESKLQGINGIDEVQSPFSDLPLNRAEIIRQTDGPIKQAFNQDYTLSTITLRSTGFDVDESGSSTILPELESILENTPVYQAETSVFGDIVRFDELGESLQADAAVTTGIGLVLVFATSSIMYASLVVGIVSLLPIIIAVVWAVGLMGFFNVPFTQLSTGIVSLVLGIGVDFSIHLVNSIRQSIRRRKTTIEKAINQALHTTGGAIFLSSLTTFFGFVALTFAQLLGTQRLGWSLAFSIVAVFAVCILFVPAVLSVNRALLKD